jgi:ribosomal-protein-alanine N-acetyltransferase
MNVNIPLDYTIKTKRLALRIPSKNDIPFIFKATRYVGFNDGMLWDPPKNMEELNEPFVRNINSWKKGKSFTFSIDLKGSKNFVGRISIRKTGNDNNFSVGFFTIPEFYGSGYMSEALEGVLDFGFKILKANTIEACHALWNVVKTF